MRILFVAESIPGSRSSQRQQALYELGHSVLFVPTTPNDYGRGRGPSFAYRVSYRLRLPFDLARTNAVLRGLDARIFEVALFDNFKSVRHRTLRTLKDRNPEMRL
ncbi:MAG: hypothetical protein IT564_04235, partial [Rhodospirillales bacterium]|nr:hypothetical protein [Rhodospirillales bacterium]